MKPRIWSWKTFVPGSQRWKDGTFILGNGPLPSEYFNRKHMLNMAVAWIRKGTWTKDCKAMNSFYSTVDVRVYDVLRRHSWK